MTKQLMYEHGDILNHTPDHSVSRAIHDRLLGEDDSYRLGLIIEGGGMRGVVSGGMVAGLESLGITDVFDRVYGVSAGAINGAYYMAGQARHGVSIYHDNLTTGNFISYWRALLGGPLMSVNYLMDTVCEDIKPLNYNAILNSPGRLVVQTTELSPRVKPSFLRSFSHADELKRSLKASARVPGLSHGPIDVNGRRFVDGAALRSLVGDRPEQDGCTHLLYLLTNPYPHESAPSYMRRQAINYLLSNYPTPLVESFHNFERYHERIDHLHHRSENGTPGPRVQCLSIPADYRPCPQLEQNPAVLKRYARAGARQVGGAFLPPGATQLNVAEDFTFYRTEHPARS